MLVTLVLLRGVVATMMLVFAFVQDEGEAAGFVMMAEVEGERVEAAEKEEFVLVEEGLAHRERCVVRGGGTEKEARG